MAKRPKTGAAGTPAVVALERAGVAFRLHPYEHDPASGLSYGLEAAASLGVSPARVFKTLVTTVDGALTVAVVPVDCSVDLKALARASGAKRAAMADVEAAERATGYVVGGISPLGQRQRLSTVVDTSALEFETIFVSAGRRGLDVELGPITLVDLTNALTGPISRPL